MQKPRRKEDGVNGCSLYVLFIGHTGKIYNKALFKKNIYKCYTRNA